MGKGGGEEVKLAMITGIRGEEESLCHIETDKVILQDNIFQV